MIHECGAIGNVAHVLGKQKRRPIERRFCKQQEQSAV